MPCSPASLTRCCRLFASQSAAGGVRNRLGHHRRVHDHAIDARRPEQADRSRGPDRHHQHGLDTFLADALSPPREARRIDGYYCLEPGLAREVLPVRVLDPGVDGGFVGAVVGVLQIQQSSHEPGWQRRATGGAREVRAEGALDLLPVDHRREPHQRVPGVELLDQGLAEQLSGLCLRRLRTHRDLAEFAGKRGGLSRNLANPDSHERLETRATVGLRALFRTDYPTSGLVLCCSSK